MKEVVKSKKAKDQRDFPLLALTFYLLPSLAGGILMGLATTPVAAWPLAWVALVPLWVLLVGESKKLEAKRDKKNSPKISAHPDKQDSSYFLNRRLLSLPLSLYILPLLWGIGYHGTALFWITGIHPMTWMGVPWLASLAIAIFCLIAISLCGGILVTNWAICQVFIWQKLSKNSPVLRILTGTAIWCAIESIWSAGPLWWSSVSYTQSPHNLIILQLGKLAGPTTITAALIAVNGLVAEAWINRHSDKADKLDKPLAPIGVNNYFSWAVFLVVTLHLIGFGIYSQPLADSPANQLKIGLIQGNIPNTIKLYTEGWFRALEGYSKGYKELADQGVDAVLTPETALPVVWGENNWMYQGFNRAILSKGTLAWVGAFGLRGNSFTNSLFTVNGTGEVVSQYDKVKLVPLGEYIPFEDFLGLFINRLSPLDNHLAAGSPQQVFDTPLGRAIVGICYESAFAEHFRRQAALGGEFILTASNNAHYSPAMPAQHHAQDVMRAIETDRWAVRATNTGYSGIVDPHGNTIWISGINTYEVYSDTIYRRQSRSLYVQWGDWLLPILLFLASFFWVFNSDKRTAKSPKMPS